MTSPLKPWERNLGDPSDALNGFASSRHPGGVNAAPPVPARPSMQNNRSNIGYSGGAGYGGMTSGYGSMYGGGYGMGCGGYSSYGTGYGMNYGMSRFGYGSGIQGGSSFARTAEETSQPAFDSIMSVVQAFGSIAQMLESTFFAVHSSFRAVLGVADQFSSLKLQLLNTLGAFTVLKTIRYLFRKLMILLRLRKSNPNEDFWNVAADNTADRELRQSAKAWPLVLFLTVIFGTPWLIWKFIQLMAGDEDSQRQSWIEGIGEHYEARTLYDFEAEGQDELSFEAGVVLRVAPKKKQPAIRGWLLASNGKGSGIVPANYIKILGKRTGRRSSPTTSKPRLVCSPTPLDEAFSECSAERMKPLGADFHSELSSDSSPTD